MLKSAAFFSAVQSQRRAFAKGLQRVNKDGAGKDQLDKVAAKQAREQAKKQLKKKDIQPFTPVSPNQMKASQDVYKKQTKMSSYS